LAIALRAFRAFCSHIPLLLSRARCRMAP
jgi:hypothetical protein